MRTLFALAAVSGIVSAGNIYTYEGSSEYVLGQSIEPVYVPPVVPYGNYTNQTIFYEKLDVEENSVVKLKIDHGIDVGYSGEYNSAEVNDNEMWALSYELKGYAKITETFTISVAEFYNFKVQVVFDLLKMQFLKQTIQFVHPWAILAAHNENPSVALPFDLKLKTEFRIDNLLDVSIIAADNMKANFNKQLDDLVKEMFNFAGNAVFEEQPYVAPEDDTKNIANGANYFPSWKEFKTGGPVFTNPYAAETASRRIPKTKWDIPVVLELIRLIVGNQGWEWDPQAPIKHWLFNTRDNASDVLLP
jgi:hypothetical protein